MAVRAALMTAMLVASAGTLPATATESDASRLAAMTPADFLARITLHDDPLDTVATITTSEAFIERKPLFGLAPDDVLLRAFVDKATGRASYQVYVTARYRGYGLADWHAANYDTPSGPRSVRMLKIARLKGYCPQRQHCPRSETIGFAVDERLLRANAALYVADRIMPWRFKIMARDGNQHLELLSAAEISGLLIAVDAYRTDHHLPE